MFFLGLAVNDKNRPKVLWYTFFKQASAAIGEVNPIRMEPEIFCQGFSPLKI